MKTNFYILLILLLTFSFGNAQSENVSIENNVISVSETNEDVSIAIDTLSVENKKEEVLLIDATELKENIARTNSDIRIYLNRKRKVNNIKLLFPKINKVTKA